MRRETLAGRMFHFIAAVTVIILDLWVIAGLSQFKGRSIFSFLNWIIWIMMDWQAKCCLMWFSEATKSKPEPPAPAERCFAFSAGWLQTSAAFICFCFVCFLFVFFSPMMLQQPWKRREEPVPDFLTIIPWVHYVLDGGRTLFTDSTWCFSGFLYCSAEVGL